MSKGGGEDNMLLRKWSFTSATSSVFLGESCGTTQSVIPETSTKETKKKNNNNKKDKPIRFVRNNIGYRPKFATTKKVQRRIVCSDTKRSLKRAKILNLKLDATAPSSKYRRRTEQPEDNSTNNNNVVHQTFKSLTRREPIDLSSTFSRRMVGGDGRKRPQTAQQNRFGFGGGYNMKPTHACIGESLNFVSSNDGPRPQMTVRYAISNDMARKERRLLLSRGTGNFRHTRLHALQSLFLGEASTRAALRSRLRRIRVNSGEQQQHDTTTTTTARTKKTFHRYLV